MAEVDIIGETLCPWCRNELEVVKSAKSGYHYANCKSCNSHFRNIPVALVDMKGRQTPQAESKVEGSALEKFLEEQTNTGYHHTPCGVPYQRTTLSSPGEHPRHVPGDYP